jgi:L,D-peptidoglycan transpeptidase YkuD (ErfK/YbiS/YcfS/YnhG family)
MVLTPMGLRFRNRVFPCTIGRGGVPTDKREGDGATPAGVHRIVGCLYRPDRMARPCDWAVPIRPGDLWSDDPGTRITTSWSARPMPTRPNGCGGATAL